MKTRVFYGLTFGLILIFIITSNTIADTGITDPLKDENGLFIMTTKDYSNFALEEYFDYWKANHSGVDLALSKDGTKVQSKETSGKTVYAICDGEADFIEPTGGLDSFVKVHHPSCNGRDIIAYYAHIIPDERLRNGDSIRKGGPIGTVKEWGSKSHLHLMIDTQTERDLSEVKYFICDYELYELDVNTQSVINLSSCNRVEKPKTKEIKNNQMLLKMGWGKVTTLEYKDNNGRPDGKKLYISENAMKQLGFISFFDLSNAEADCTYTKGYWKCHPEAWPVGFLTLGTVFYTKEQLLYILEEVMSGNGLISLAQELIAAKLNIINGSHVPAGVTTAIDQSDSLIGGLVVPPIGSGYLDLTQTYFLTEILNDYNNGEYPGGPLHCP